MAHGSQPPDDVIDFATRYCEILNRVVGERMRRLGIPDAMIGFQYPGIDDGAFVRYPTSQIGGNINPHVFPGRRPGINVDCGVLDANHPAMSQVVAWRKGRLQDRLDAAIAHEHTEALADPEEGLNLHEQAVMRAAETPLPITEGARRILREYRDAYRSQ